jgi:hypothetical protein
VTARRFDSVASDTFNVEKKKGPTMIHSASSKASDFQVRTAFLARFALTLSGLLYDCGIPSPILLASIRYRGRN